MEVDGAVMARAFAATLLHFSEKQRFPLGNAFLAVQRIDKGRIGRLTLWVFLV